MSFILMPSLEHLTAVQVATDLLIQCDISGSLAGMQEVIAIRKKYQTPYELHTCFVEFEDKILEKIMRLPLSKNLQIVLKDVVKRVACEVIFSYAFHMTIDGDRIGLEDYVDNLVWTPYGTICKKKTVEAFLGNEKFTIGRRYRLACKYICEDFIPILWNQLSPSQKDYSSYVTDDPCEKYQMVAFTGFFPDNDMKELMITICNDNPGNGLFECLATYSQQNDNDIAFRYFWQRLSCEERDRNVFEFARFELVRSLDYRSGILLYLITRMNTAQKVQVFEAYPYKVVKYLLDGWVRQEFVLPMMGEVWQFLSDHHYLRLLDEIKRAISKAVREDNKYQKMFAELWCRIPGNLKKEIIEDPWELLLRLLSGRTLGSVKLVFFDMSVEGRKFVARSESLIYRYERLIRDGKVEFVIGVLRAALLSEDEIRDLFRGLVCKENYELCSCLVLRGEWLLLDKLMNLVFTNQDEILGFKLQLMDLKGEKFYSEFLCRNKLEAVDELLDWGFSTKEEMEDFRRKFVLIGKIES